MRLPRQSTFSSSFDCSWHGGGLQSIDRARGRPGANSAAVAKGFRHDSKSSAGEVARIDASTERGGSCGFGFADHTRTQCAGSCSPQEWGGLVFAGGDPSRYLVPDAALHSFMAHCSQKIGDAYFRTPRNTIKSFVQLLSVLEQNPSTEWTSLLGVIDVDRDDGASIDTLPVNEGADELTTLKL